MKQALLTLLRSKKTDLSTFRLVTKKLADILAADFANSLKQKKLIVETPCGKAKGSYVPEKIVLLPILRAGMALVPSFLHQFENAKVGFLGIKRDEETAKAYLYYEKLPKIDKNEHWVILEPMIATGGTAILTLSLLIENNKLLPQHISFVSVIAAKEGFERVKTRFPKVNIHVVAIDEKLNDKKYIVPGLGDFGDRFFGT